jgi:NADH dehydrogenase
MSRVRTAEGPDEPYGYLVLATGARPTYFGQAAFERASEGLNDLLAALRLRDSVLARFEAAAVSTPGRGAASSRF